MVAQSVKNIAALFAANAKHTLQHDRHKPHAALAVRLVRDRALQMLRVGAKPQTFSGAR